MARWILRALWLLLPAAFPLLGPPLPGPQSHAPVLAEALSGVLLVMYGLSLGFTLRTHRKELLPVPVAEEEAFAGSLAGQLGRLSLAAAATAVASEVLVGSLEGALTVFHL